MRRQAPFSALSRPREIRRQRWPQPVRVFGSVVTVTPVSRTMRAPGISLGTLRMAAEASPPEGRSAGSSGGEAAGFRAGLAAGVAFEDLAFLLPALHRGGRADEVGGLAFPDLAGDFLDAGVRAHDAGDRVFIRDGQRAEAEKGGAVDVFLRVRGAGQEGEVRRDGKLGEAHGRF